MKRMIPFALCALLSAPVPALAQEADGDMSDGLDLLDRGMRLLLQGMLDEMGPAMQELRDALDDLTMYEAPEILPNGDIIIRRKQPLPEDPDLPEVGEDGEVEL